MLRFRHKIIRIFNRCYTSNHTTLNDGELIKFRKLANEWWDVHGPFKALHSLNQLRVPFIRNGIQSCQPFVATNPAHSPLANCSILDVGCGGGLLSECLARLGANVTALDPCEESIAAATLHSDKVGLSKNITYVVGTIESFKEKNPGANFDAITASEVIEHLENSSFFIGNCSNLLKPGGSIFLTTINRTTASWTLGIVAAEYLLNLVPRGTHEWNKFITPEEMVSFLGEAHLQVRQLVGMGYNPLTNNWNWTKSLCINYAVHASKNKSETASENSFSIEDISIDTYSRSEQPSQA